MQFVMEMDDMDEKNDIHDEILKFLKTHSISELMQIIGDVLEATAT